MPLHRFAEYMRNNHGHRAYTVSIAVAAGFSVIVIVGWYVSLRYEAARTANAAAGVNPLGASVVNIKDLGQSIKKDFKLLGSVFESQ